MTEYTAFFYGTLMHPKILTRVLKNDGSHLLIAHAVLYEYTRYKVKYAAFPGITPTNQDINLNDDSTYNHEQHSVEGTLVIGLTESDMEMLDEFEGSQYERKTVQAHPLSPFIPPSRHQLLATPGESKKQLAVEAETYVYREVDHLEHEPWSFEEFLEKNAWMWFDERRLVAFSETGMVIISMIYSREHIEKTRERKLRYHPNKAKWVDEMPTFRDSESGGQNRLWKLISEYKCITTINQKAKLSSF